MSPWTLGSIAAVNETTVYATLSKSHYDINITSCALGTEYRSLDSYNNRDLDYYLAEDWLYIEADGKVVESGGTSAVFYETGLEVLSRSFENRSDNSTIWITHTDSFWTILEYLGTESINVDSTWGVSSYYYDVLKLNDSTTWLWTVNGTYAYKLNMTEGLIADAEPTTTGPTSTLWDFKLGISGMGTALGLSSTESYLLFALLMSLGVATAITLKLKTDPKIFVYTSILMFLCCWGFGLVDTYLILLLAFAGVVMIMSKWGA